MGVGIQIKAAECLHFGWTHRHQCQSCRFPGTRRTGSSHIHQGIILIKKCYGPEATSEHLIEQNLSWACSDTSGCMLMPHFHGLNTFSKCLLYYCITVSKCLLYYCFKMLTVLLDYCFKMLNYYCITVSKCLLYYCITVLLFQNAYCIT